MNRRRGSITVVLCAGLVLFLIPALGLAQAGEQAPLTKSQIYELLQGGKTAAEVAELVKVRGVDFTPDAQFEQNLTALKADPVLLKTIKTPARLTLQLGASGVLVSVDGEERGTTGEGGSYIVEDLAGGNHVLRFSSPDHVGKTLDVFLKPGEDKTETVELTSAISTTPSPYGSNISVAAGTSADAALAAVYKAADAMQKIELLNQVATDFADSPIAILAYDLLQQNYLSVRNYDAAFAAGEKLLERDPRNLRAQVNQARAATGKGDIEAALDAAESMNRIVEEGKTLPPPEGVSAENWAAAGERELQRAMGMLQSLQYELFQGITQRTSGAAQATALERFAKAFPDSNYTDSAYARLVSAYFQLGDQAKVVEAANIALERDPDQASVLVVLTDVLSERGEHLDRARQLTAHLLDLLVNQPEKLAAQGVTPEFNQMYQGVAHSTLGQIHLHQQREPQAIDEFQQASPLLKSQPIYYARNLYRLAFVYARIGGRANLNQAKALLNEVISLNTPYTQPAQQLMQQINQVLGGR